MKEKLPIILKFLKKYSLNLFLLGSLLLGYLYFNREINTLNKTITELSNKKPEIITKIQREIIRDTIIKKEIIKVRDYKIKYIERANLSELEKAFEDIKIE